MDEDRGLGMRKHLDCLAAKNDSENDSGHAVATVGYYLIPHCGPSTG
jgi:hypothetical protein